MKNELFIDWFRNCSPYIHAHRNKVVVLNIPGELLADGNVHNLICDIALLNSLGVKLVIVHGARHQLDIALEQKGIYSEFHQGRRVTDGETLDCLKQVSGQLKLELEALLSNGLTSSPMAGASVRVSSGNYILAKPLGVKDGIDFQHTGDVRRIDHQAIQERLSVNNIVLISPVGYSLTGEVFNLSSYDIATAVAKSVCADKLLLLTTSDGVQNSDGKLLRELNVNEARKNATHGPEALGYAIAACDGGVERTHILNGQVDGALLFELFTRDGCGTMVTKDNYEACRPASIDDVGGILALTEPLEREGTLVSRSRETIETDIDNFIVIERDGAIIGCASLHKFPDTHVGELACLVVHPDYQGMNRGERMLKFIQKLAIQYEVEKLIALTTSAEHWFVERGFTIEKFESLPEQRRTLYNPSRGSKVYAKNLFN